MSKSYNNYIGMMDTPEVLRKKCNKIATSDLLPEDPKDPDGFYYLVSFPNEAASVKAWQAFSMDMEWKAAKAASETSGPLLASQSTTILRPMGSSKSAGNHMSSY